MARIRQKTTKNRPGLRASVSLPDIKGMVGILKSLYSPSQLREIVAGLGLAAEQTCSDCNRSTNRDDEE
jgi:hypothetical protein